MKVVSDSQVVRHLLSALNKESILNEFHPTLLKALAEYEENPDIAPERTVRLSNTPDSDTTHLFMPCIAPHKVGVKVISGGPTNAKKGLGFQGCVMVLNEYTGQLEAIVDAKSLTAFRTALASSLGLARVLGDSTKMLPELSVFGSGPQAFWHVYLAVQLFQDRIERVNVISRSSGASLAQELSSHIRVPVEAIKLEETEKVKEHVQNSSIVFGCTPSQEGIIRKEYLNTDPAFTKFVSVIGSYKPHMIELDLQFIEKYYTEQDTAVLVDSKDHTLAEAGELIQGKIKKSQLVSLTELYGSAVNLERLSTATGVVWQKLVGLSVMDIAMAKLVMNTKEGTELDFV
ncbi:putative ornithine cyclodeaminase [Clavispora lusitaniae]|uniref:Ornithine cyclodeaminase n=1 Tax=Clavispora lusitaniae TaxID=36911 RepID=A0AA91PXA8_CLALS|nr:putative ornithine cyclodeaminase [Clavispora lusitaniae]